MRPSVSQIGRTVKLAKPHSVMLSCSSVAVWRNWQTQQTQNLPGITPRVGSIPSTATTVTLYTVEPLKSRFSCNSLQTLCRVSPLQTPMNRGFSKFACVFEKRGTGGGSRTHTRHSPGILSQFRYSARANRKATCEGDGSRVVRRTAQGARAEPRVRGPIPVRNPMEK
jgi:hypothetical protein